MNIRVERNQVYIDGKRARRITSNGSRQIFTDGNIVVKLNDQGESKHLRQSSTELRRWNCNDFFDDADRKYFEPPLDGKIRGNGWIAQKFIRFRRGRRPEWSWKLAYELGLKYHFDFSWGDGERVSSTNWGIREDGTFVIYDFAV